jgi:cyclase
MLKTRVMPCLLLENGRLVKTVKFNKLDYIGDPLNAIRIYNEKEVDELILLDIRATTGAHDIPFQTIADIAGECFMPLTYGGGIRKIDDIKKVFELGVEKVAINSYALENPDFITEAAKIFGSQSIIVSIDVRKKLWGKYEVFSHSGSKPCKIDPVTFARQMQNAGAGEILLTSIDQDGTWEGYDINLVQAVTQAIDIPLIASGGAGKIEDFAKVVKESNCSAVAAGSMFVYQGKGFGVLIKFPDREVLEKILL